jgi:tRNA U34 5-methylaminomethyl-2-thiouridine-forming methyltransferase MnmC
MLPMVADNIFEIRRTGDGSSTLYSATMQESYHSLNGAVQESMHVFIQAGLQQIKKTEIRILEVGLGTGLNALLTWEESIKQGLHIDYVSLEAFPVPAKLLTKLNYKLNSRLLPPEAFWKIHESPWEECTKLDGFQFRLTKLNQDFTHYHPDKGFDLVYFDAFAPDKQPEMWEESLLEGLYKGMNPNGIFVTYCAKGEIRRRLQRAGFEVERLPGPPGKREMLRAVKH